MIALLLLACVADPANTWDFPVEQGPPPGSPRWDTSIWRRGWWEAMGWDPTTETLRFQLKTEGWGYEPVLYLLENRFTRDWDELHTLAEVASTTGPRATYFRRDLEVVQAWWDQVPDQTTILGLERYLPSSPDVSVTVAALVRDDRGRPSDCIVFGYDPAALAVPAVVSYPDWLDPDYCRNVNP